MSSAPIFNGSTTFNGAAANFQPTGEAPELEYGHAL
jgi:hypothetical protein